MELEIKALSPALLDDFLDFFDYRAFADGSPYYPCYCGAFNLSGEQIRELSARAETFGGGAESWKRVLRDSAVQMVKEGIIQGYLTFDDKTAIGWCNANDRVSYCRVGEFDLGKVPLNEPTADCRERGIIKSIVCFEIAPGYRGRGIASMLLERVCKDAKRDGYEFVEVYPIAEERGTLAFTGPIHLYQKAGFHEHAHRGTTVVMRKALKG